MTPASRPEHESAPENLSALGLTAPVAMGYIPLGMAFGFLFVQAGASSWLAILTSLFVYAGAAQYMMIPMVAAGQAAGAIALATLIVNLRHMFYGLSLLDRFPPQGPLRWYMIFALTDETYSVLTAAGKATRHRQMALIAALNHGWWVLGTALGALLGTQAKLTVAGLDFVLVALFAVLTVEQWRTNRNPAPLFVALVAYTLAWLLAPRHAIAISMAICLLAGLIWQVRQPAGKMTGEGKDG